MAIHFLRVKICAAIHFITNKFKGLTTKLMIKNLHNSLLRDHVNKVNKLE